MAATTLTTRSIFKFWRPLAATWLMMSFEGPFVAAIIARLAEPKNNLAAFGVAFSFALVVEAPIIMIMSATVALVSDRASFLKVRTFIYLLNFGVTVLMLALLTPRLFFFITTDLIELPDSVAHLVYTATWLLLPWPSAIGYRRFYQGIMIRRNLTRRVAYGTIIRISSMSLSAACFAAFSHLPGAAVGGLALATGVTMEALASRVMARHAVRELLAGRDQAAHNLLPLGYKTIVRFYYPLAFSSMITLGINPMVTLMMGKSRMPIESLAVLPVINSLNFVFTCLGLSFQEVGIALLGNHLAGYAALRRFAWLLGTAVVAGISLIAFTPFSMFWFQRVSGLSSELARLAIVPLCITTLMPGLMVLLSWQRALMITADKTELVTWGTVVEVGGIIAMLIVTIYGFNCTGVIAATSSFLVGRLAANLFLAKPFYRHRDRLMIAPPARLGEGVTS